MSHLFRYGALALTALALVACSKSEANDNAAETRIPTVAVEPVSDFLTLDTRKFAGRLAPVSTVDMSFRVGGELIDIPLSEGVTVKKGALLAALDPVDYELALRQAELSEDIAKSDFERKEKLIASRSVSEAVFDQAETEYELSKVAVENARRDLVHTRLTAPFDALITRRLTDTYTNVSAGQAVLRIQDISELRVQISVPEDLIRLVEELGSLEAEAQIAGSNVTIPLKYREHNTEANSVAQTYEVTFGMVPPEGVNLLPGMTASVTVRYGGANGGTAVSVPVSAVDTSADGAFRVWVFDAETGAVTPREVELGNIEGERVPVLSGLTGDEQIVIAGGSMLREGMAVRRMSAAF